jgi:hypothetical protein
MSTASAAPDTFEVGHHYERKGSTIIIVEMEGGKPGVWTSCHVATRPLDEERSPYRPPDWTEITEEDFWSRP